jgi:hypothetical protein
MDWLPILKSAFWAVWVLALTIGGLVVLSYLALESVFPRGLTLSDSFLLIYTALIFGGVMVGGTFIGCALSYWIVYFVVWCRQRKGGRAGVTRPEIYAAINSGFLFIMSLSLALLVALLIFSRNISDSNQRQLLTLGYFLVLGVWFIGLFGMKREGQPHVVRRICVFLSLTVGLMVAIKPILLDITMSTVGLRSNQGELVALTAADKSKITALAEMHGLSVEFCDVPGTKFYGTTHLQVVWHRVGDASYVRLTIGREPRQATLLVSLSSEVEILRSKNLTIKCLSNGIT